MRLPIIHFLVAVFLSILVLRPILGNVWYPMHDTTHIARLSLMSSAFGRGEFPPLWAEGINNGYGYPLFHFYAPLFYYLALGLTSLGGSYIAGLKLALALCLILGVTGVMQLSRRLGRGAMLLSGVLFATSPYLAVDLYVRGAYSELTALCLLPWVFAVWQDLATPKRQVLAGWVTAAYLLSHNLIPLLSLPLLCVWVLLHQLRTWRQVVFPGILSLLLASTLLLPLLFERHFVQADVVARTSNYALHFVEPWQLWNSTWGYGGSAAGVEDGFAFKVGKLHLLLALLGTLILIWQKQKHWVLGAFAVVALFMATSAAIMVWQSIPILTLAQFPWRYLAIATSLLAVTGSAVLFVSRRPLLNLILALVLGLASLQLNLKYFTPQETFPGNDAMYLSPQYLATLTQIIPEYLPTWMPQTPPPAPTLFQNVGTQTIVGYAYYPNWRIKLDGQWVPTFPDVAGRLSFDNPTASSQIEVSWAKTPVQQWALVLTILGLIASVYWLKGKQ